MKKTFVLLALFLVAVLVFASCGANAQTSKKLDYVIDKEAGYARITGRGDCRDAKIVIPDKIKGYPVTEIGSEAFWDGLDITSVVIPDSITKIGDDAFSGCENLESVYIADLAKWCAVSFASPNSNPLFYAHSLYLNGELLSDAVIPDGVTSIGSAAFVHGGCLKTITIPESVTEIGSLAFYGCSGLTEVRIPDSVLRVGEAAFAHCFGLTTVTLPDNLTSIERNAFGECIALKSINIPQTVTTIGDLAFFSCHSLENIDLPSGLESIGENALAECPALKSITIPQSVNRIDNTAFLADSNIESIVVEPGNTNYKSSGNCLIENASKTLILGCKNSVIPTDGSVATIGDFAFALCDLADISIPNSVTEIRYSAFRKCVHLKNIVIPKSVVEIDGNVFNGCNALETIVVESGNGRYHSNGNCLIETERKTLIAGCRNSVLPTDGSITEIGDYAFNNCIGLESILIPESVIGIGNSAFSGCSKLTKIIIPESVTRIGSNAFSGCSELTEIIIPSGIKEFGDYVFSNCKKLENITFNGTKEQWNAIMKEEMNWDLFAGSYTVHCTDGDISK